MKNLFTLLLSTSLYVLTFNLNAQNINNSSINKAEECGTDDIHRMLMQSDSTYKKGVLFLENQIQSILQDQSSQKSLPPVYTIPVVVHVIEDGVFNITDATIQGAIDGLNDRFRKIIGTGIDSEIQFCLAITDPNCGPATGINRVDGTVIANYAANGIYHSSANPSGASANDLKDLSIWPYTDYYNIWVANDLGAAGGWAYYPSVGNIYDGTVIRYNYMNYTSTTLTHELGHGFNLRHTFEGDDDGSVCPPNANCTVDGDKVCDTPPHRRNDGCTGTNTCTGGILDSVVINYMSYCSSKIEFILGQKDRMRATLLVAPRASLLNSQGCTIPAVVPVSDFSYTSVCDGGVIDFKNSSANCSASWNWSFPGGTPSSSTLQNPTVTYDSSGTYNVSLTSSNAAGTGNTETKAINVVVTNCGIDSTKIAIIIQTAIWGSEISWSITDAAGDQVDTGFGYLDNSTYYHCLCIKKCESYSFNMYDSYGDGWQGGTYSIVLASNKDTLSTGRLTSGFYDLDQFTFCDLSDAGVTSILSPVNNCGLTANESITIVVTNFSSFSKDSIPVSYKLNGGTVINDTIFAIINQGDTISFTFTTTADLSASDSIYIFDAWTNLADDGNNTNDSTLNYSVDHIAGITSFPYFENFESGTGGWYSGGVDIGEGVNNSWAFGTPAKTIINSAGSGVNSWISGGLSGNYVNMERSYVISPCFDFTGLTDPVIELLIWYEVESGWDGAVLQSTINNGATWQNVGTFGDPFNWYNIDSLEGFDAHQIKEGWTGDNNTTGNGSGGWLTAKNDLTGLGNQSNVILRIVFGSDWAVEEEGFAFDDIFIYDIIEDVAVTSIVAPVTGCGLTTTETVIINVANYGTDSTITIPVSYRINGTGMVNEVISTPIPPGDTISYTFTTFTDLSVSGSNYIFDAWTDLAGDINKSNDSTLNYTIINIASPVINLGADTSICDSIILDAGYSGASYNWSSGASSQTILVTTSGTYYVEVNVSGCPPVYDSIDVTINSLPTVSLDSFSGVCDTTTAFALTGGNPPGGTYSGMSISGDTFYPPTAGAGTHNITYIYTDTITGCTDLAIQTITVLACPTGINELSDAGKNIRLYPNPNKGVFTINFSGFENEIIHLTINDIHGKTMINKKLIIINTCTTEINGCIGELNEEVNITHLPKGMYFLKINTVHNVFIKKIFVQ